jgi:medium-chain acyl-[acyl-carrier-protein] hydrolase
MRLILFPYAGSGPATFWKWAAKFPDHIESWIAHYPGRGSRYNEAPAKKMSGLVEGIFQALPPLLDKPFAFFGHSLGGLVAFELTRSLRQNNLPRPQVLFISACSAPHLPDPHPRIHKLPNPEFVKALQELNGIPEWVANQPELLGILIPTLRADFEVAETYQYNPSEQSLTCPIVAFGGITDPRVSRGQMEGWASHTFSEFKSIYFPGDHFFLNAANDEIIQSIIQEMMISLSIKHKSG